MPDFVLDALNQCLPSKEQEETVLYGPAQPSPNTLLVPGSDAVGTNHVHNHIGSRLPGSSGNWLFCFSGTLQVANHRLFRCYTTTHFLHCI